MELESYDFDVRRKLAVAYEAMGDSQAAERANIDTAALRDECWYAFNHLGSFYSYRGRFREAEQHFLRVVQLASDNAIARANLGFLYLKLGRFPDALMHGKEAARLGVSIARMNVGRALFFQKCYPEAVEELTAAARLLPGDPRVHSYLGEAYKMLPREEPVVELFERSVQLAEARLVEKPGDLNFLPYLSLNLARTGKAPRAVAEIEKALRIAPDNPELHFYQSVVLELAGQRQRAIDALEKALRANYSVFYVNAWPELADLRADPAYVDVVRKLRLDHEVDAGTTSRPGPGSPCTSAPAAARPLFDARAPMASAHIQ